jgi:hypothetical protein
VSGPEELFDYPNFRWWLRPELLETLDLSRPEGLNALATARLPFAVTFGAAEGTFGVDSHTFNPDAPQPLGTTLRATRYRILAVMAPDAAGPTRRGLRGRYGCPVVADVSLESCRRVEAELCTAVHS